MATLNSYIERILPQIYRSRYTPAHWVGWANALLERLSKAGYLPPQRLTRGAVVQDEVWVDRPPMSRDILELRSAANPEFTYRFAEENNRLRLIDARFPEAERREFLVITSQPSPPSFSIYESDIAENSLKGWLCIFATGAAAGHTFIISGNTESSGMPPYVIVNIPNPDVEILPGNRGYFFEPKDYLIVYYEAKFQPVITMGDDLRIDGYENIIEAWFRWKVEEQVSTISQECAYWMRRFQDELANLRGELYNRVNKPRGRSLAGFRGN